MRHETREMLDKIDEFLSQHNEASRELWMILAATRGPDNEGYYAKEYGTIPVREAAFPKTAVAQGDDSKADYAFLGAAMSSTHSFDPFKVDAGGTHFTSHIKRAAAILGIFRGVDAENFK